MIDPIKIIQQYYNADSKVYDTLIAHGEAVSQKALSIAERLQHLKPDMTFIQEAAMLHDIGIFMTHVPELDLRGQHPYICHGILGRKLLENEGLHQHARVCENHVGTGISRDDVKCYGLPLPEKDMLPETLEEEIICYADKFFSKNPDAPSSEIPVERIIKGLEPYGRDKVSRFLTWKERFE